MSKQPIAKRLVKHVRPAGLPSFRASPEDRITIGRLARRAAIQFAGRVTVEDVAMDLTAVHANGCPLDLGRLLRCSEADFVGIRENLDRSTGKLANCFDPRCSMPTPKGEPA